MLMYNNLWSNVLSKDSANQVHLMLLARSAGTVCGAPLHKAPPNKPMELARVA